MKIVLNIVGAGHVGRALGHVLADRGGVTVQDVLTRSMASAADAIAFIGGGRAIAAARDLRPAPLWMLAVPDDRIAPAAAMLADLARPLSLRGAVVFHCSGAKASGELAPLAAAGAHVASVHPIRSFADPQAVAQAFAGTFCGVEGDGAALALLAPLLARAGARSVAIDAAAKTVYHAASVFASNYLVTVLDAALRAYRAAGIPEDVARELAAPLAGETLANVLRLGAEGALSGPIARGDTVTVARQQAAVGAWDAPTGALYAALAEATRDLARRKHGANADH
ncbi:DUF2520 domain-containing protein [Massilia forsythiae]|uniref:DUF2520 domain-containing protein n=1 Tax=Massilia forsythiae TaxID=2728020 RepID=A0A7Z2ZS55_9BURK|nr:Rossmann-like and DUF2520 domain-containing protein [Massilia forsythiae]QJD99948.1 DUF2520 domain-containing protein [Massilia forsythiae]